MTGHVYFKDAHHPHRYYMTVSPDGNIVGHSPTQKIAQELCNKLDKR